MLGISAKRILIVDDEKTLADSICESFEMHGFEPCVAYSASEALARLDIFAPHLVVTDVRMPGLSGEHLISEIMKSAQKRPVLFCMSGNVDLPVAKGFALGVDAYFKKPFSVADMLATATRFLNLSSPEKNENPVTKK